MNDSNVPEKVFANASREEIMAALFANMVIQQTNMALMLLGKVPHPETGEMYRDLESAKMFIDQLEMIEVKTKGNLDKREEGLLKQSLTSLRMAFVEEIDAQPEDSAKIAEPVPAHAGPPAAPEIAQPAAAIAPIPPPEEESRKKYSKKY